MKLRTVTKILLPVLLLAAFVEAILPAD